MTATLLLLWLLVAPAAATPLECARYPLFQEGTVQTFTRTLPSGKVSGVMTTEVRAVTRTDTGAWRAELHSESFDSRDKAIGTMDYLATCDAGGMRIDMQGLLPTDEAADGWTISVEGAKLAYPADLVVGQDLPDATMHFALSRNGVAPGSLVLVSPKLDVHVRHRKVEAIEILETPAGPYLAFRITYDSDMTMTTGLLTLRANRTNREWYVPGVGAVQFESYKNGNLRLTTTLSEMESPAPGQW